MHLHPRLCPALQVVLQRCPLLLTRKLGTVQAKAEALAAMLGLGPERMARILYHFPTLLLEDTETVRSHLLALAELLGVPSSQVQGAWGSGWRVRGAWDHI